MSEKYFTLLNDRSVLKISGEDCRTFLQGLVSNDIQKVSDKQTIYSAFLPAQGKFLHDFFIAVLESNLYLDCEASRIQDLYKRLKVYKLRSKVEIRISEKFQILALFGTDTLKTLGLSKNVGAANSFESGIIYTDPRLTAAGARCMVPKESIKTVNSLGFTEARLESYQRHRILLGLPDSSQDMEVEKSTLLESGFEELNGVDFDKGCFMGQELTARTKYRGLVKKRLIPIRIDGETPSPGQVIEQDGKNVGELRSVSGNLGIAIIRLEALEKDISLRAGDSFIIPKKPEWANF